MSDVAHTGFSLAAIAAILVGCQTPESQNNAGPITIGARFSLQSEILNEEREFLVHLPSSYADETYAPKAYPALYLLDGGPHFPSVTGVVNFMSEGINGNLQIPEHIVVAIPNTDRTRDLTPTESSLGYDGEEVEYFEVTGGGDGFLRNENPALAIENLEKEMEIAPEHFWSGWTRETLEELKQ